jgi:asparagine synthase (glutamine-hydrolysing)
MCGIAGVIAPSRGMETSNAVRACVARLRHRGPDQQQVVGEACGAFNVLLGHTRLAIIDLTPGGSQPMMSGDGRYTIVFNGEIYNYPELRKKLQSQGVRFSSESDTEVLLEAWAAWGPACLTQLVGMFAFAVLDRRERTVTLVRDAFGVKPLFWSRDDQGLRFASELPALAGMAAATPQLDRTVTIEYLLSGTQDLGPETFVRGISSLLPAHLMKFSLENGTMKTERWWTPSLAESGPASRQDAAEQLRDLFLESVRLHMRSDVPVGVALSGGIDSSAIVCGIRHLFPEADLHTFSYVAEDGAISEERWIDAVNGHVRATPHKVRASAGGLAEDLDALITAQGEPFGGTMLYAQYCVFRAARDAGVKVVLEGQGGDEMLGGYGGFPGFVMRSRLERLDLLGAARFAGAWWWNHRHRGAGRWRALVGELPLPGRARRARNRRLAAISSKPWLHANPTEPGLETDFGTPYRGSARGRRLAETLLLSMTRYSLPHLLRYGDRNAMAFSIENRVPFVTLPIAEFVLRLPERHLVSSDGGTKSIFRLAMRGIVPDVILDRHDKVGFSTPMRHWMRKGLLQRLPSLVDSTESSILRREHASDFVARELFQSSSQDMDWTAWRVFNLMQWQRLMGVEADRA